MREEHGFLLFEKNDFGPWLAEQEINRKKKIIQNHHTWKPDYADFNGNNHFELLQSMRDHHVNNRGWDDIGQHVTTFPDGKIAACRSLKKDPACIRGHNIGAICIENLGNFDINKDQMKAEHKEAIIHANAILCKKFHIKPTLDTICYHHWFASKTCPGTDFFGGNTKQDAEEKIIPLIVAEIGILGLET